MNRPPNRRPWTFLLLLSLTILILAFHETGQLTLLEDGLSLVTGPIQRAFSGMVNEIRGAFSSVGDARELQAEVEELRALANDLAAQSVRLEEIEVENQQLRALLNFVEANPSLYSVVGGDVVGRGGWVESKVVGQDPNPYIYYVLINRGSQDGLEIGMPVVAGGGRLVGRIAQVRPRWSKVQLLIDPSSEINGVAQESRANGLVTGQPDGSLTLEQVEQSTEIAVDDVVVTSGLGGAMPKGLILGQVTEVQQRDIEPYQRALLRPAVDFNHLELVLVITDFEPIAIENGP